jgi:DNA (cytosine-5)-methyltransferase 1
MKIIDLFAGVGGLSLGFENAGFETIASVDLWEDAIKTYNNNRQNKNGLTISIQDFNSHHLNKILATHKVTGVIGGPPCQGFSSARLSDNSERIGLINKERNQLYLEFYKTIKLAKPEFFLMENVRGLLNLDKGAFVEDILNRFGKLGYSVTFELLNAADFGVPQNRHRVFFIGLKNKHFEFPKKQKKILSSFEALSDLPLDLSANSKNYISKPRNSFQKHIRNNSKVITNHQDTKHSDKTKEIISMIPDGGNIKSIPAKYWEVRKFNKAFQRMNSKLPSLTIDTGHRNYFHFSEHRIPTVRESARLQSFPDTFEFVGSKTSQYKQVGNAVPPLLAYALALQIKNYLIES